MNEEINYSEMLFNRDERLLNIITNLQEQVKGIREERDYLFNKLTAERDHLFNKLTAESTEWESKCYKYQDIIDELEKYILNHYIVGHTIQNASLDNILNKLKELKEGK